jgi:hypothetical protein
MRIVSGSHAIWSLALVATFLPGGARQGSGAAGPHALDRAPGDTRNRRPVLVTDLPVPMEVRPGQEIVFTVQVSDPDGDRVSLDLIGAMPGVEIRSLHPSAIPARSEVRWRVPANVAARPRLCFRAKDGHGSGGTTDYVAQFIVRGREGVTILTDDVTGDGVPDVVGAAILADVGGTSNTGAIHVWEGGPSLSETPLATLAVPGAAPGDRLGLAGPHGLALVDVTGDGVLDIVAGAQRADVSGVAEVGAIHVFAGGALSGVVAPVATLTVPGAVNGDRLGSGGIFFEDVTGDGQVDVVASAPDADAHGVPNAGAIHVWRGGASLSGALAPHATLSRSTAAPGDHLGIAAGESLLLADVTGDAVADVVAAASSADIFGFLNAGAVYLWSGGPALTGDVEPDAILNAGPSVQAGAQLGQVSGQGLFLVDVSGDGPRDVVAGAEYGDGLVADSGLVFVWRGGGIPNESPDALLQVDSPAPMPAPGDRLGHASGNGIQVADLTGDGILDLVVGAELADIDGVVDAGAVYVWKGGGGLVSTLAPHITLRHSAMPGDRMGSCAGQGVSIVDITGNGQPEIVAGSSLADISSPDVGAIFVWNDSRFFSEGDVLSPDATLTGGNMPGDRLGDASGQGIQFADVTGDGILDVIAGCSARDLLVTDRGTVFVWEGGPAQPFSSTQWGELSSSSFATGDRLGFAEGQGVQLADVTGDGVLDVVATAQLADVSGTIDAGAIHIWAGGSAPGSEIRLRLGAPQTSDRLGSASGQGVVLVDFDDDGALDVIAGSRTHDVGATDSGAVFLWRGGPFLSTNPDSVFEVPGAAANDQLGLASVGLQFADVTDDGVPDLLVGAQNADAGGVTNSGAIYLWTGGSMFPSSRPPDATFADPAAAAGDRLGAP